LKQHLIMKKGLLLLILFSLTLLQYGFAQYSIKIDSSNTFSHQISRYGSSYLITVPLRGDVKNLYIDNSGGIIPAQVLFSEKNRLWYKTDTLIVSEKGNNAKKRIKRKNTHQFDFDEYIIVARKSHIDTLTGIDNKFLNYKELKPFSLSEDSILVYYVEEYGSVCCPEDPIWKIRPTLGEFIKQFEDTNKVRVGQTYYITTGKEREQIVYFTLDGLTPVQKIYFLTKRYYDLIPNKETKKIVLLPEIYMPVLVSKKYLKPGLDQ
jgi:hypothetical protein